MRKSKNYKYKVYNGRVIKDALENSRLYVLIMFFICGLIIGSIAIRNEDSLLIAEIRSITESYKVMRTQQEVFFNFLSSFIVSVLYIAFSAFLAFSLIGYPFITMIPMLRGIGIGAVCGYLYSAYKFTGLGYALLTIYPSAILTVIAIVISCNDSCEYSKNAYMKAITGKGQFERGETRIFLIRQLVFIGVCGVSSLIESFSTLLFSGFFSF